MEYTIRKMTPELADDYFDFFENRAFSDGSPFYPCYCTAYNMSKERIDEEFVARCKEYGGGDEGWKRALRECADRMVSAGEVQGYLVYERGIVVGWCNSNDRLNYYRVGEFDPSNVPADKSCSYCKEKGFIKSVVCFEIAPGYRGKGIASLLLNKVCEDAKNEGYTYVEGYPVKDGGYDGIAFTGPMKLYERLGFEVYEQNRDYTIVRKKL